MNVLLAAEPVLFRQDHAEPFLPVRHRRISKQNGTSHDLQRLRKPAGKAEEDRPDSLACHRDSEGHSMRLTAESRRSSRKMPPYIRELYRTRLLDRDEEVELFTLLAKLTRRCETLAQVSLGKLTRGQKRQLDDVKAERTRVRNCIVEANLRLVVSIARQFVQQFSAPGQPDLFDFISEGNEVLLRAVDRFDVDHGTRFSTYTTTAIRRQFIRLGNSTHQRQKRFVTGAEQVIESRHGPEGHPALDIQTETHQRRSVQLLLGQLVDRERVIVEGRFGFGDAQRRLTFRELGEKVGVSKERVRQLHDRAMEKLRAAAALYRIEAFGD